MLTPYQIFQGFECVCACDRYQWVFIHRGRLQWRRVSEHWRLLHMYLSKRIRCHRWKDRLPRYSNKWHYGLGVIEAHLEEVGNDVTKVFYPMLSKLIHRNLVGLWRFCYWQGPHCTVPSFLRPGCWGQAWESWHWCSVQPFCVIAHGLINCLSALALSPDISLMLFQPHPMTHWS